MGLILGQEFLILAVVFIFLVFLHKVLSPLVELPRLPEHWIGLKGATAQTIFKDDLRCCEDLVVDHECGYAIISSDSGRVFWNALWNRTGGRDHQHSQQHGRLLLYDYAQTGSLRVIDMVNLPASFSFHPLGISLYHEKGSSLARLFVANQQDGNSSVEILDMDYENAQAVYVCTISDQNHTICSPVSVAARSYTSFYVTNDLHTVRRRHPVLSFTEKTSGLPAGWVTLVDCTSPMNPSLTIVAHEIPFVSGIVVTPTGKEVLVASNSTDVVRVYECDPETHTLSKDYTSVYLSTHPGSLAFDKSLSPTDPTVFDCHGKFLRGVIVTGSPDAGRLFCMAKNPHGCVAPSVVAEIRRGPGIDLSPFPGSLFSYNSKYYARTLYADDGTNYPSSISGQVDSKRGRLIVSGLHADGLLDIAWNPMDSSL